jgi:hypothetical protein
VPPRSLPGNANLEQLKNGAKSFQRAVRAGDAGAARVVNEFHPRLADAQPGSPELNGFTRTDAQLVVARQFGFSSWPKLKAHMELIARYARSPHEQPVGEPLADDQAVIDEFLRLACLTYGDDDPDRFRRAQALLEQHEWLPRASIHTIAATGDVDAARELLDRDPSQASLIGGPHGWEPLLYLTYSRVPLGPGRSAVAVARLLLEHGADPNAGYLWEGLIPPFTALTGALGGGGTIPKHPEELALARLLLQAGADANDGQALYNQGWGPEPQENWLQLLFEFGLGTGDGGPWRRLLGERQDSPQKMLEDLLIAAAGHGLTDRVRRLLARGVDPEGRESKHPIYQGRSPVQEAALNGHMDIVSLLVDAGASWKHDAVDEMVATAMSGDHSAVERLLAADPGLRGRAIERCPDQLVRAAEQNSYDAVAVLIELGFNVNARSRTTPLHEAAMRGNLPVIKLLLDHGADPNIHDTGYDATPGRMGRTPQPTRSATAARSTRTPRPGRPAQRPTRPRSPRLAPGNRNANRDGRVHGRVGGTVRRARIAAGGRHRLAGPPRRGRPDPPLQWTRRSARTDADRPARQQRGVRQRVRRRRRPRPRARPPCRRRRARAAGAVPGRRGPRRTDHQPARLRDRTRGTRRAARRLTTGRFTGFR